MPSGGSRDSASTPGSLLGDIILWAMGIIPSIIVIVMLVVQIMSSLHMIKAIGYC